MEEKERTEIDPTDLWQKSKGKWERILFSTNGGTGTNEHPLAKNSRQTLYLSQ
jgi:hypothetical protein